MKGLKNAKGFIRHLLAERVNLRNTPELIFKLDDSVEYAVRLEKLIKEVTEADARAAHSAEEGNADGK